MSPGQMGYIIPLALPGDLLPIETAWENRGASAGSFQREGGAVQAPNRANPLPRGSVLTSYLPNLLLHSILTHERDHETLGAPNLGLRLTPPYPSPFALSSKKAKRRLLNT